VLRSMVEANALIVLGHDQGTVAVGDEVDVLLFEGIL
jgi:molybdopterin molybdotransferase